MNVAYFLGNYSPKSIDFKCNF